MFELSLNSSENFQSHNFSFPITQTDETILSTGRTNTDVLVLTLTERTSPSLRLLYTPSTRAGGQRLWGMFSSRSSTISFTARLHCGLVHF